MRFQILFLTALLSFAILFTACGGGETANTTNTANANSTANANAAKPSNTGVETTKKPEEATTNNAPTLTPIVNAFNEALKKKDDAGLRKLYSQTTLKAYEADMKEEGAKSLVEFISDLEPVEKNPFQARNEQISGDTATVELRGGSSTAWSKVKFVKENGEWKITNENADVDAVKQAANSAAK